MAIVRPVTKTLISVPNWGVPITDEVNRLTTLTGSNVPSAWTNATLLNGWSNHADGGLQYRKVGDIVYIRGRIVGVLNFTSAWNIPAGFRPARAANLMAVAGMVNTAWAFGHIDFRSNGDFVPFSPSGLTELAFNNQSWSITL